MMPQGPSLGMVIFSAAPVESATMYCGNSGSRNIARRNRGCLANYSVQCRRIAAFVCNRLQCCVKALLFIFDAATGGRRQLTEIGTKPVKRGH